MPYILRDYYGSAVGHFKGRRLGSKTNDAVYVKKGRSSLQAAGNALEVAFGIHDDQSILEKTQGENSSLFLMFGVASFIGEAASNPKKRI